MSKRKKSKITEFQNRIILYYKHHGRSELPWRQTNDPWKVLLAELLLRKTTSAQASKVYNTISSMSPSELANIEENELEEIVCELGMQNERTKILREVGQAVDSEGESILTNRESMLRLHGVGNYAANAVLCFSFNEAKPTLDRNMIRVLERVFSYESDRSRPHTDPKFWDFAEDLVPAENPKEYNWGILDFAAKICSARTPNCSKCCLNDICDYWQKT